MFENYEDGTTEYTEKEKQIENDILNEIRNKKLQQDTPIAADIDKQTTKEHYSNNETMGDDVSNLFNSIFNKSNIILIISFLGIYFVAYFGLGLFFNKGVEGDASSFQSNLSRVLDILFLCLVVFIVVSMFYSYTPQQQHSLFGDLFSNSTKFVDNPYSIFSMIIFLLVFYMITYLFRVPMSSDTKPIFISFIENVAWIIVVIIAFIDFFKYVLGISLVELLSNFNLWGKLPDAPPPKKIDSSNNNLGPAPAPVKGDEVFNVSNNSYTYDDAQSICTAYGAKLATYDQVEDAYKKGAEWCNYGWSDGQMIFFPTQKATWQELQKDKKHKNDCGRPGVNGGYIANPYIKFGVNCYGKKPKPTDDDLARMNAQQNRIHPKSAKDAELDEKVKYWKEHADKLLKLNSHSTKKWSEY